MLDEHGFGDDGTRAAGTGESGERRQQMEKQDGQIAHGTMATTSQCPSICSRFSNSPCTREDPRMQEVLTAPGARWQNAYAERFIGSVRRECLDHVIVLSAAGLRRILNVFISY